ncbi:MAG: hypothetical protein A2015_02670 [Spirochaetes bacterium GWF1_31_7]|nr:MAG: hypothetical protein A2Y30_10180 [Spirochaetes bacterium GWE1_32_154]OHD44640.1 MAG: hypothetical protein A2Y29_05880 [Spirochaetes bacterium GWE2_31_10]OHD53168.1 MAG: hypothetical protein A2015_02670 [Spirochaetes bacterium GWF1_31_7]HBD94225.1 hypothetical protein [Spirochaetia bacterium]HBI39302.1 hypothetical protein [Spirochaetia bacterium]
MDQFEDFNKQIFSTCIENLKVRNSSAQYKAKYSDLNSLLLKTINKEFLTNYTSKIKNTSSIYNQFLTKDELKSLSMEIVKLEFIFIAFINDAKNITFDIVSIWIDILILQLFIAKISITDQGYFEIYFTTADSIFKFIENKNENPFIISDEQLITLKRIYYLANHEYYFKLTNEYYNDLLKLINQDIYYSKSKSIEELITVLNHRASILNDFYEYHIENMDEFFDKNIFQKLSVDFKLLISKYLYKKTKNSDILKLSLKNILDIEIRFVKRKLFNKEVIDLQLKKKILYYSYIILNSFNNNYHNINALFTLTDFSKLNEERLIEEVKNIIIHTSIETNKPIIDVIYIIYLFLSLFPEYVKHSLFLYKFIMQQISPIYSNRRQNIILAFSIIRFISDTAKIENEVLKIKKSIECDSVIGLITLYNCHVESLHSISKEKISSLKISNVTISLQKKISHLNNFVDTSILNFKNEINKKPDYKIRCEYIDIFRTELTNIIKILSNANLVTNISQYYSDVIDNYTKENELDFREDFINKSTLLKMSLFDINPLNLALAILFFKIGKLKLIITHENPARLGLKKTFVSTMEREEIAKYLDYSPDLIPTTDNSIDWGNVKDIIRNIRNPAVTTGSVVRPESRILKVISAILNKLTRTNSDINKIFPSLYEESYLPTKRAWDLDPILIHYFNIFFTGQGVLKFYNEHSGSELSVVFQLIKYPPLTEKTNSFIKDLVNTIEYDQMNILQEFNDMIKDNEIQLNTENGKKNFTITDATLAISRKRSISFESSYLSDDDILYLYSIIQIYCNTLGKSSYFLAIKYAFGELLKNANKANLIRAHFHFKNIDIDSKYLIGISSYDEALKSRKAEYCEYVKKSDMKIKIRFHNDNEDFIISIINNYKIHDEETDAITDNISTGRKLTNLSLLYKNHLLDSKTNDEGLVVAVLLLKKIGLKNGGLKVNIGKEETKFSITVPLVTLSETDDITISEEIIKEIKDIPMLPDNLKELRETLDDADSSIEQIEAIVLRDPSLAADILKIANSSYYGQSKSVISIKDGIKLLGTQAMKNIVMAVNCYKVLQDKLKIKKIDAVIKHSEETTFYSSRLIEKLNIKLDNDKVYLASLLHDIGKIVVESIQPDIYEHISTLIESKNIPVDVLEGIAGGINHSLIGSMLLAKWDFPDQIIEIVKYHHSPRNLKNYPEYVFVVYLANMLTHFIGGKLSYYNIDSNVLEFFNIHSEQELKKLGYEIKSEFNARE